MRQLTREEAWHRLGTVTLGRVVFTERALPAIRPVSHVLDHGQVIIAGHGSAVVTSTEHSRGTVVGYEADDIGAAACTGWSVMITGLARLVDEPGLAARYLRALRPWAAGDRIWVISIDPQIVGGFELAGAGSPAGPPGWPGGVPGYPA